MQLPEAKAMSEWLAVIRIQSKSRSKSRPRDKYHVSHTYRMVFMADITIILLLQPGPCWHAGYGEKLLSRSRE